jgi:PAS domain S-box-containing protein
MGNVLRSGPVGVLSADLLAIFGADADPIEAVAARARERHPGRAPIVWECDASSFHFGFVSDEAEAILGHTLDKWLTPSFWAERVVHQDDRDDAVTYCSLATAKASDHMFEYRACARDGRTVWLRDYVKVVKDARGAAAKLRGVMFDVSAEKGAAPAAEAARMPTREELAALA